MTTKAKIYSPNQVALISWLVPVAAVFVLAKNFDALGNKAASMRTMLWGGLFVVWLYGLRSVSLEPPFYLAYIAFINAAHQIAARSQMSSLAISHSKLFDFQSEGIVAGVIAAAAIVSVMLSSVVDLALESLGIPVLE